MRGNEAGARFEKLADRLTSSLGGIAPEGLDGQIQSAQREICACLDLDLALVWERAFDLTGTYGVTHAWDATAGSSLVTPSAASESGSSADARHPDEASAQHAEKATSVAKRT